MPSVIRAISKSQLNLQDGFGAIIPGREVLQRARRLAVELNQSGTRCVGLRLDNGIDWICADIACLMARVPLVPIPMFFTAAQVQHIVESTGMDGLIGSFDGVERVFEGFEATGGAHKFHRGPHRECDIPEGTAKVTFTSGTTGEPKGVCISRERQEKIAGELAARTSALGLKRHLTVLPLPVLLENVAGAYGAFMSGADLAVPPLSWVGVRKSSGFNPRVLVDAIRTYKPDSLILLPQMLKDLVELIGRDNLRVRGLKFIAVGGARTAPELISKSRALGLPVYEGYGLTEACSVVSLNLPGSDKAGSVGRPLFADSIRLGASGEIEVSLPDGQRYLGEPVRRGRWFPTGDLGEIDAQGFIHVLGRRRQVLVTAFGRNVSPEWVESELLAETAIAQAMVTGDDQRALGALLVPAAGARPPDVERALARCNQRLPDYARIAAWREVERFSPENGRLTANGRLRRKAIHAAHEPLISALFREIDQQTEDSMNFYQRLATETEVDRRILLEQPVIADALAGRITLPTYLDFLEQAYHHVRHTVPLLMACGARLPARLEWMREAVAEYIEEESGHQEWILQDISACNGDAEAVRHGKPAMATDVMVAYAWDCVMRRNPVGFFGMVYVLEGTSVAIASNAANAIQKHLKLPDRAFSYLRSHGALDQQHIEFFKSLVNRLEDSEDRAAVLDTARVMYRLYARIFATLRRPGDQREAA